MMRVNGLEESIGVRSPRMFTIGHSDRTMEQFLRLLESSTIKMVVDVRSNPASVRFPHFERRQLAETLDQCGIFYRWFRSLGGNRKRSMTDRLHTALPESLRPYASAMNEPDFDASLAELIGQGASAVTAILCAERDPRCCHRHLLSDKIQLLGVRVVHIIDENTAFEHQQHPDLVVEDENLIYRSKQLSLL